MKPFAFLSVFPFLFASCATLSTPASEEAYVSSLDFKEGFKLMQLTDLHWSKATDFARQEAYLRSFIEMEEPDLIMITGDSVLAADEYVARRLYSFVSSFDIPFAVTYGNHDYQGSFSPSFMDELVTATPNSLTKIVDDEIKGKTNFLIELHGEDGEAAWRIYGLDSSSLMTVSSGYDYDYIDESQAAFYSSHQEDGVPNLVYFHIPLWEWGLAFDEDPEGLLGNIGEKATWTAPEGYPGQEDYYPFFPSKVHSPIFGAMKEGGAKGVFVGHDHANDWVGNYDGVTLGYGVKTGRELYYGVSEEGHDITGYALMELYGDGGYDLSHVYVDNLDFEEKGRVKVHVD